MPGLQPGKITVSPNDWEGLLRQLNYLLKDIYSRFGEIEGIDGRIIASRLIQTNTNSKRISVLDLTAFIAGSNSILSKNDGDGTITLSAILKAAGGLNVDADGLFISVGSNGFPAASDLTIAAGEITVTGSQKWRFHNIDTEGGIASDNLDKINGGNEGEVILIQAKNSARTVVMKDGVDLKLQADFSLNNIEDKIILVCAAVDRWHEITRANNGA